MTSSDILTGSRFGAAGAALGAGVAARAPSPGRGCGDRDGRGNGLGHGRSGCRLAISPAAARRVYPD